MYAVKAFPVKRSFLTTYKVLDTPWVLLRETVANRKIVGRKNDIEDWHVSKRCR